MSTYSGRLASSHGLPFKALHSDRELASSKSRSGQQAPVVCTENTGLCRASVVCTEIRGLCRAPVVWRQTSEIPNVHVYGTRARVILGRA